MKRIFTIITLLAMIILAGCTDLDDINRQLDEQEKELATVRALLNAMTNKVSVVSYKELPDGSGYELTMSDGNQDHPEARRQGQTRVNAAPRAGKARTGKMPALTSPSPKPTTWLSLFTMASPTP